MMINKRLISICEESKKYMFLTLLCSWIGIICNIAIIFMMGLFINAMVAGETLSKGLSHFYLTKHLTLAVAIPLIIILLIAKFIAHHYYGKFSYKSSAKARSTLRSLIYEKLLRLGMDYQK